MKIEFNKTPESLTVSLDGRLDTVTAPDLETFFKENLADASELIIDCEKLIYISSAGLRVLLSAQKQLKNPLQLINVGELVNEVLEITGFADIFKVEK